MVWQLIGLDRNVNYKVNESEKFHLTWNESKLTYILLCVSRKLCWRTVDRYLLNVEESLNLWTK